MELNALCYNLYRIHIHSKIDIYMYAIIMTTTTDDDNDGEDGDYGDTPLKALKWSSAFLHSRRPVNSILDFHYYLGM